MKLTAMPSGLLHMTLSQVLVEKTGKSYENREDTMTWLNSDPVLDDLRSEPRFQDLVRRVGLSQLRNKNQ
jgi:hypothetical protein